MEVKPWRGKRLRSTYRAFGEVSFVAGYVLPALTLTESLYFRIITIPLSAFSLLT
jgi:hypothetical protein